jgi:carbon monoxide dehydrogenase subunit G
MDFTGRYVIAAPPQKVWDGINDPAILKACIPGCEQLDKTSPTDFVATARLKIGPLSAAFKGKVQLTELEPPHRLRLSGEGQGGVAGFAKGDALVTLTPDGDGTVLTYTAKANVGGKLAQIGQRLIDGAAKQIADDFFKRFAAALEIPVLTGDLTTEEIIDGEADACAGVGGAAAAGMSLPSIPRDRRAGLSPTIWVTGLIAVVAVLLLLFAARS